MSELVIVALTILISIFGGMMSALLGIGGGLIFVPLFHYLLKLNMHQAVGTSLAIIVPTALVGAWKHGIHNYVSWKVFFFAVLFSIIGGLIGAHVSVGLDADFLKKIFGVFLIIVAIQMIFF